MNSPNKPLFFGSWCQSKGLWGIPAQKWAAYPKLAQLHNMTPETLPLVCLLPPEVQYHWTWYPGQAREIVALVVPFLQLLKTKITFYAHYIWTEIEFIDIEPPTWLLFHSFKVNDYRKCITAGNYKQGKSPPTLLYNWFYKKYLLPFLCCLNAC